MDTDNPFSTFTDTDLLSAYGELLDWDCGNGVPEYSFIREIASGISLPLSEAQKLRMTKEFLLYEIANRYKEIMEG